MATANSSNCDPQSPDDVPVILPPDLAAVLAAEDVTDVLLSEVTAPLVTISIEERALAPAAPLLRVSYLECLLEAVGDGTPLDRLSDALRPALTLRLRTVFLFVPQPVAACLRIPVAARRRPKLASVLLSEQHPSACCYLAAKWQLDYMDSLTVSPPGGEVRKPAPKPVTTPNVGPILDLHNQARNLMGFFRLLHRATMQTPSRRRKLHFNQRVESAKKDSAMQTGTRAIAK